MVSVSVRVALALGALQGVLEWLPVSSEGNVALVLTVLFGFSAVDAVGLSLFLHAGTALAAGVYYRGTLADLLRSVPDWRPRTAFDDRNAELSFLAVGTLVSGVVGVGAYATLDSLVSALTGGGFVAVIGALLVASGLFQRLVGADALGRRTEPGPLDAVLVGVLQGIAVLPGVSRSGATTGGLLLRGHDGGEAFRLSFLLSIPAALGAGGLAVVEAGGPPSLAPVPALAALGASALVGLATIDALLRVVERLPFWAVCVGLGGVALLGAGLLLP
ncbi:undecaprenyl-diphosphate phosphatase [Candidatus Halobonum tyrrellensis]|uniref:Undecaprenyl-diphosphatase n=1 Tax=Candidatus Halobonum tyrrellensis G22 TaxID=1324957 RepID=V4IV56_9EURY|nr:undecaprenyl-diphosphate phosphatase [Candidatus Halobonum tyrrellensis]ESP87087.1 Undecaprenyl-diphosphatase [Candidatus Halobonum tyrrellensis G22]